MKEIEVGDYVRTENGIIDKVDALYGMIENTVYLKQQSLWFNADYIVKHSKQLIDLIEEGDYVNGELITDKWDTRVSSIRSNFSEEDIKTILTKESYLANCYKVGGGENEASND